MRDFKGLNVWQKSHRLTLGVYQATDSFPARERYGLAAQMRRASVSAATNIAEGCGRASQRDFNRFLQIPVGSANELEYHLLLAHDLGYLDAPQHLGFRGEVEEVRRMLSSLMRKVAKDEHHDRG